MNFVYFFLFTSVRVRNKKINLNLFYIYVIVTNARVGIIRSWIFTDARVRNIANKPLERKPIKFSNLRQKKQCSLPQAERLRGANIFPFT